LISSKSRQLLYHYSLKFIFISIILFLFILIIHTSITITMFRSIPTKPSIWTTIWIRVRITLCNFTIYFWCISTTFSWQILSIRPIPPNFFGIL